MKHLFRFVGTKINETTWSILDDELFHLKKVLRLKEGEELEVIDLHGNYAKGMIASIGSKEATVQCEQSYFEPPPKYPIIFCIGALKHGSLEEIICPLIEIGIDEFHVFNHHQADKSRINEKLIDRLSKLAISAVKQSKRCYAPTIKMHPNIEKLLESLDLDNIGNRFILDAHDSTSMLHTSLKPSASVVIVGGESGFSESELQLIKQRSFEAKSLGLNILRSTTAALSSSTVINLLRNEIQT